VLSSDLRILERVIRSRVLIYRGEYLTPVEGRIVKL